MHGITFLQDLAVVMIVAGLVTIVFHRLKQPVVLGYIIAGVIIGPHTPPYKLIHDEETIKTLSEMGIILLMFSLGLEFSLGKLKRVGAPAFIAAILEIALLFAVGFEISRWFGWPTMDGIFLGAMLSMSSSTVIVKVLGDLGKMRERFAQLIFGILIIEDILGIAMIALLSGIAMTGALSVTEVGITLSKLGIFMTVVLVAGLLSVPRLIAYVARFKSNEMMIVTVLGLCFGVSLLAVKLGYSVALGAFVIGAVIAESREIHQVEKLIAPVRDMFSAIFFVAIGLLIEPEMLTAYWLPILVITVAVIVGKVVACSFGTFIAGNDTRTALRVGMGLAQIGEFSFIIAALGLNLGVTSKFLYPIAVMVSVITTLLTPYLIRSSDGMVAFFDRHAPRSIRNSLQLYTLWLGQRGENQPRNMAAQFIRKWSLQIALNIMLVAGIFIAAVFLSRRQPEPLKKIFFSEGGINAALWFGAVFLSLPMLIAIYRKLQALGMLLADLRVKRLPPAAPVAQVKAVISTTVPLAGAIGLGLLIFALSAPLLPSGEILLALIAIIIGLTFLLWRSFVKVYSKAQVALNETFAQTPLPMETEAPAPLKNLLKEAKLESLVITETSPMKGRALRDLALRTQTGASIVAIERSTGSVVNPGPDDELQTGDEVLLLGSQTQLAKARQLLQGETSA